jgi:hypothetical protein
MKDPTIPGPPPGSTTKLFTAVVLVLSGIGLGIFSLVIQADAVDQTSRVIALVVAGVVVFLCLGSAYALYRVVYPPSAKHLRISLTPSDVRRGSEVVVRLEIAHPDAVSDALELGLVCTEYYDEESGEGRATRQAVAHEEWHRPADDPLQTMRFPVPADAPYSYRGSCLSFVWRVSAREPRRLRFDRAVNVPLVVRP